MLKHTALSELQLSDALSALITQNERAQLYAFIDGTHSGRILSDFFTQAPNAKYSPLFLNTEFAECIPHSPYLAAIDKQDLGFIQNSGSLTRQDVIWFVSDTAYEDQIAYWKSLLTAYMPSGDTALFRFWSGSVMTKYLQHSNRGAELLAPMLAAYTPHHEGQHWVHWVRTTPSRPLLIHQTTWWHIERHELQGYDDAFNNILADDIEDGLWRRHPQRLQSLHPQLISRIIHQGLVQAKDLGLTDHNNLRHFIFLQFEYQIDFWKTEAFMLIWKSKASVNQDFAKKIGHLF